MGEKVIEMTRKELVDYINSSDKEFNISVEFDQEGDIDDDGAATHS